MICKLESAVSESIFSATLADVELEPGAIPAEWILSGNPETRRR